MAFEAPHLKTRLITRSAYGFDPQGQLVSDVSSQSIRAVYDALSQTLRERFNRPDWSDKEQAQALKVNIQAWIEALNASLGEPKLVSEAWIKGTMHMYSTEFFFLADYYARLLCEEETYVQAYLRALVRGIVTASFMKAGSTLATDQLYLNHQKLFQHAVPLDLRVTEHGRNRVVIQWHALSALSRVGPEYRADFLHHMRDFIRILFEELPLIIRNDLTANVSEYIPSGDITEWRIEWAQKLPQPRYWFLGLGLSIILLIITLAADIPALGYISLVPALLGLGWDIYKQQRGQIEAQRDNLLGQIEYSQLQNLELNTVYANLRNINMEQERQLKNLLSLRDAVIAMSKHSDQDLMLEDLQEIMTGLLNFDRALVLLRDRDRGVLKFGTISHAPIDPNDHMRLMHLQLEFNPNDSQNTDDALLGPWVKGQSVMVDQPAAYYHSRLNWVLALIEFNTFYSAPLMLGTDLLGVLLVDNHFTRRPIARESRSLIDSLSTNIAIAMENTRLYHLQDEELKKTVHEMRIMERIDSELANTLKLESVLELLLDWALRFTYANIAFVVLVDENLEKASTAAYYGHAVEKLPGGGINVRVPLDQMGLAGLAIRTGRTLVTDDVSQDPQHLVLDPEIKSQLSVPIRRGQRIVGAMTLESLKPAAFQEEHVNFVERIAPRAGVAVETSRLFTEAQQERQKLRAILGNTADAVIVINRSGRLELLNNAAVHVFRLEKPLENYIGKPFEAVFQDEMLHAFYERVLEHEALERDIKLAINDKVYHANAALVDLVGFTIILHDVTPFIEVDNLKNELVSTVSHDLKNPLSVMNGYVDLLRDNYSLDERGHRYLNTIQRSIENMRELIENLLDLARIESGLKLKYAPTDLRELTEKVEQSLSAKAELKNLVFVYDFDPDLPSVLADEARLQQVLTNLMGNAVKYTLEAGEIILKVTRQGDDVLFAVQDQGVGIAEEELQTVWERFVRVRNEQTQSIDGSGLGLAIVKTLVEAHGGKVGVESTEDVGSTFYFWLPINPPQEILDQQQSEETI